MGLFPQQNAFRYKLLLVHYSESLLVADRTREVPSCGVPIGSASNETVIPLKRQPNAASGLPAKSPDFGYLPWSLPILHHFASYFYDTFFLVLTFQRNMMQY